MDDIFTKINNLKKYLNTKNQPNKKYKGRHYRPARPSLININNSIQQNISALKQSFIIEDESSESNSVIDVNITNDIILTLPSLTKVSKILFDENTIMITNTIDNFPKEAIDKGGIGLLIVGLEQWVSEQNIAYFLEQSPCFIKYKINGNYTYDNYIENKLKINYIKSFDIKEKFCVFVCLPYIEQIKILGEYFMSSFKKTFPTINSKGEPIEFYYAYDLLTLTKNYWYGVILRNLPKDCTSKSIFDFCENVIRNRIKYCLNPIYINNVLCSLVVCKELENAELLCYKYNNFELVNKKIIKANLHPNICKIRRNTDKYYSFGADVDNSEICFNTSKPCTQFLEQKNESNNINGNNDPNDIKRDNKNNFNNISDNKNNINNNENNLIKNKKNKLKESDRKILMNLKNILDLKNKKVSNTEKENLNQKVNIDLDESQEINDKKQKGLPNDECNSKKNDLMSDENNINIEEKEENIQKKDYDIKYYSYNFPEKSFFDNLKFDNEYDSFLYINKENKNYHENNEKTISIDELNLSNSSHNRNEYINNSFYSKDYNINYNYKHSKKKYYGNEENYKYDIDSNDSQYNYYDIKNKKSYRSIIYDKYDMEIGKEMIKKYLDKMDIVKFNKIINNNKKKENEIIYELKCNNIYVKNMKITDIRMLEGELNIDDIDRIINEEKHQMQKYLGKKYIMSDKNDKNNI